MCIRDSYVSFRVLLQVGLFASHKTPVLVSIVGQTVLDRFRFRLLVYQVHLLSVQLT